ncbi:hypothetical protein HMPREF0307_02396 [Corynebacterium sp. DNF00584]|nr:hypothetical protein HMPREF0307_02396 [Corynebacterium sp. DNF00584]
MCHGVTPTSLVVDAPSPPGPVPRFPATSLKWMCLVVKFCH